MVKKKSTEESLYKKRAVAKAKIKRVVNRIANLDDSAFTRETVHTLTPLLDHLEAAWKEFSAAQDELCVVCDIDSDDEDVEYDHQETLVLATKTQLSLWIQDLTTPVPVPAVATPSNSSFPHLRNPGHLKLPKLDLPSFSGAYADWTSFYDLFNASVDANDSLSKAQKLHYLKSTLKGDASKLLTSIQITDDNYQTAKDILERRFGNLRAIVRAHVHAICSYPGVKHESASALRKLQETIQEHRLALLSHGVEVEHWDPMLVYLVTEKLDPESRKFWELSSPGNDLQTYDALSEFLEIRSRALEASPSKPGGSKEWEKSHSNAPKSSKSPNKTLGTSYLAAGESGNCPCCKEAHKIYTCVKFKALPVPERSTFVQKSSLCFNCLSPGHAVKDCKSSYSCRECKKRHHNLLHKLAETPNPAKPPDNPADFSGHGRVKPSNVLLATAMVPVKTHAGRVVMCRALLDGGSQLSFVSENCTNRLGAKRLKQPVTLTTVGGKPGAQPKGAAELTLLPPNSPPIHLTALVLPKLTSQLPTEKVSTKSWRHLHDIKLADPGFRFPGDIDLILGADVYDVIVLERKIHEVGTVFLKETLFGWVVSGSTHPNTPLQRGQTFNVTVDSSLRRFWELEEPPTVSKLSPDEIACEKHYSDTTDRDQSGRFVVKLPFKKDCTPLGDSLFQAQRRFTHLERRLNADPPLKQKYSDFVQEFVDLDHLEKIPEDEINKPAHECFYLPHHCVQKNTSTTTKLRVVFDGSAKTTSGVSLNESLLVGPKIQDDLFDTLLRYRFHRIALSGDIAKMYRQVALSKPDKDFHRLLWRADSTKPIQHYRMTRVTYGIASSAYHSVRTLKELAIQENDPIASPVLKRDFYIDDLLSGAPSVEEAIQLQDRLIAVLKKGGCDLRKWSSNSRELTDRLPPELRETTDNLTFEDHEHTIKTLGIRWSPSSDVFSFLVAPLPQTPLTKRALLSDTARLFDPIGWLAPVVIKLKCFMQETWVSGMGWDDPLPESILKSWLSWRTGLSEIEKLTLGRCILAPGQPVDIQLHVFCDASEAAYAAAVYVRVEDHKGQVTCNLLTAKTRVAPVKAVSIPRLELCAALLGAQLMAATVAALSATDIQISAINAWTDSTVTLAWIAELPRRWTCFVANRVALLQEKVPPDRWHHVRSKDNPADCASRGMPAPELLDYKLWWKGPDWLKFPPKDWPSLETSVLENPPERRTIAVATHASIETMEFPIDLDRFSSFSRLTRTFAYCLRFLQNLRQPRARIKGPLKAIELAEATRLIIKATQNQQFAGEICVLKAGKQLPNSSRLLCLAPFIDSASGLLKVGGRLSQSEYSESVKFPILLNKTGPLSQLLIRQAHKDCMHGGTQLTLSTLRQRYWILSGRDTVRAFVRKCVRCARFNRKAPIQIMGDLPEERITPSRPFDNTGLDFAGPLLVKYGNKCDKAYVAVFVCFVTKSIHLELVSSLTKDACLAALRRFIARRGRPTSIFSDNGTNFIGARNELLALQTLLASEETHGSLANFAAEKGIQWVTIPPRSPHFGGLWEAAVKSAKYHLRRIVGNVMLDFEELTTILTQIEAVLNSRPLVPLSSDPNDIQALTPGHFLIGGPLLALPESDNQPKELSQLKRWKLVQALTQTFWNRWQRDYLHTLQERKKWVKEGPKLSVGDLVLIAEDNVSPLHWAMGRIKKLILGNDQVPRVAEVKTSKTVFLRPVTKLRVLPVDTQQQFC